MVHSIENRIETAYNTKQIEENLYERGNSSFTNQQANEFRSFQEEIKNNKSTDSG